MASQFKAAGIPVPPEFSYRKSYSLAPKTYGKDYPAGAQSIGILCLSCYPPACLTYCLASYNYNLAYYKQLQVDGWPDLRDQSDVLRDGSRQLPGQSEGRSHDFGLEEGRLDC